MNIRNKVRNVNPSCVVESRREHGVKMASNAIGGLKLNKSNTLG